MQGLKQARLCSQQGKFFEINIWTATMEVIKLSLLVPDLEYNAWNYLCPKLSMIYHEQTC